MSSFGSRLREERERLGVSVAAMATHARVSESDQIAFEDSGAPLDASYLSVLPAFGADLTFIITGERLPSDPANARELNGARRAALLACYSQASESGKRLIDCVARLAADRTTCGPSP